MGLAELLIHDVALEDVYPEGAGGRLVLGLGRVDRGANALRYSELCAQSWSMEFVKLLYRPLNGRIILRLQQKCFSYDLHTF